MFGKKKGAPIGNKNAAGKHSVVGGAVKGTLSHGALAGLVTTGVAISAANREIVGSNEIVNAALIGGGVGAVRGARRARKANKK